MSHTYIQRIFFTHFLPVAHIFCIEIFYLGLLVESPLPFWCFNPCNPFLICFFFFFFLLKKKEFTTHHSLNDNISFGNVILRKKVIKTLKW